VTLGLLAVGAYAGLTSRNSIVALAVDPSRLLIVTAAVLHRAAPHAAAVRGDATCFRRGMG